MVFMDPISIVCEECRGKKFQKDVLSVKYKGKNIFEVLNLTVEEAREFFKSTRSGFKRAFRSNRGGTFLFNPWAEPFQLKWRGKTEAKTGL